MLIVSCGTDKAVEWTRPEDIVFDTNSPVGCLGQMDGPAIFYARVDGAVKYLKDCVPPQWFQAIVTPAGGEKSPKTLANFGKQ